MSTAITMPQLGESVTQGTVARWYKQPGDLVQKYEPLLDVVTDKVDTEVPAPVSGRLLDILVPVGQTVLVGTVLAHIGDGDSEIVTPPAAPERRFLSPVVARMLEVHQIDPDQLVGTGQGGRITKRDVLAFLEQRDQGVADPAPAPDLASTPPPQPAVGDLVPLSPMRQAIAAHMEHSVRSAPQATTIFEVDLSRVVQHRNANQAAFAAQGVRLTYTAYFFQAAVVGLQSVRQLNARFSPEGIVYAPHMHLGMAVALDDGLLVPVVRHAEEKNLLGLARAINDLSVRARSRRLLPDETQGGTFTITNHGSTGSLLATPIIAHPQAGILGIGAITKRPVVVTHEGQDVLAIKPMCYLALTFDHRVLDGAQGDAFLMVVKRFLEAYA
ncbi:dehydrogenase catalytic domain-containing protein [Oscillochloris trichoides DG-6]|uniref:Dihydrolipoamide acetyltransferase component of pyruvate dehydrogenase complex n=1 Tax=Oscillochloris trichoides DG-6 TaxID=765420 RepID=E1IC99_9CHLR|nr:dihydrolipoamide acetyltransferase family protein [Oscillochloris trichoides]EFO81216.1 dehydrogenase catalytic domain-containing protein [Oscillochloris trichoides DG-6]